MSTSLEGAMSETERVVRALLGQATADAEALVRRHPEEQEKPGGPITPQLEGDGRDVAEGEANKVRATGEAAKKSVTGEESEEAEKENLQSSVRGALLDISTINAQLINAGPAKILELMQTPFRQENV